MKMYSLFFVMSLLPTLSFAQIFINTSSEKIEFRPMPTPKPTVWAKFTFKSDVEVPFTQIERAGGGQATVIEWNPLDVQGLDCRIDLAIEPNDWASTLHVSDYGKRQRNVTFGTGTILYAESAELSSVPRRLDCVVYAGKSSVVLGECDAINRALQVEFKKTLESNEVYKVYLSKIEALDREIAFTEREVIHEASKAMSSPFSPSDSGIYLQLLKGRKKKIVLEMELYERSAMKSFVSNRNYRSVHNVQLQYLFQLSRFSTKFAQSISCLGEIQEVSALPDASDSELWHALGPNVMTVEKFIESVHSPQLTIELTQPDIWVNKN